MCPLASSVSVWGQHSDCLQDRSDLSLPCFETHDFLFSLKSARTSQLSLFWDIGLCHPTYFKSWLLGEKVLHREQTWLSPHPSLFSPGITVFPMWPLSHSGWVSISQTHYYLPAKHRCLEDSLRLTFKLGNGAPLILPIPAGSPGFPYAGDWH